MRLDGQWRERGKFVGGFGMRCALASEKDVRFGWGFLARRRAAAATRRDASAVEVGVSGARPTPRRSC